MADESSNPSPIANPSQGGFGDVLRYLLPIIGGVAAGAYPGMARGVGAATGIMGLQQDIADKQFESAQRRRLSELQDQQARGIISAVDAERRRYSQLARGGNATDPTAAGANTDPSPRSDTGPITPSAKPFNSGGTGTPAGRSEVGKLPNQVDGMTSPDAPSALALVHLAAARQYASAMQTGPALEHLTKYQELMGMPSDDAVNRMQSGPGVKLEGSTRTGKKFVVEGRNPTPDQDIRVERQQNGQAVATIIDKRQPNASPRVVPLGFTIYHDPAADFEITKNTEPDGTTTVYRIPKAGGAPQPILKAATRDDAQAQIGRMRSALAAVAAGGKPPADLAWMQQSSPEQLNRAIAVIQRTSGAPSITGAIGGTMENENPVFPESSAAPKRFPSEAAVIQDYKAKHGGMAPSAEVLAKAKAAGWY